MLYIIVFTISFIVFCVQPLHYSKICNKPRSFSSTQPLKRTLINQRNQPIKGFAIFNLGLDQSKGISPWWQAGNNNNNNDNNNDDNCDTSFVPSAIQIFALS